MINLITFDLDETLWDGRPALIKAEQAQNLWLQQHYPRAIENRDSHDLNQRKRDLIKQQPHLIHHISRFRQIFLEQLLLDAGVPPDEACDAAMQAFGAFIARRNDVELFKHAESVLEELNQDYTLAAITNGNADVSQTPLAAFFSFALKAEDVGAAKPAPDLFLAAMAQANSSPEQIVHVGDSHDHDIVGAHGVGIRSVWLTSEQQPSTLASGTIQCLSELPNIIRTLQSEN